ncbi:TROVE domain-containing protein [Nocardia camponoti]|uniref:60 kDa SS-A/Ro ribonucleoprotein n=1 Tax=Nocardia camponoti TaxID=1616106 RepID=A0A917QBY7_9NOCA|nr:TROVE domain-containing protein [Nocardia camponoti]GGK42266.1 60 kDa SS-A/Ro ribonucleoprotein [Nocardia camponoti]
MSIFARFTARVAAMKAREKQPPTPPEIRNNAGGFTFAVTPETRVRRFLTLGTESGSFYVSAPELRRENAEFIVAYATSNTAQLVREIVDISTAGRAPRPNPALFALAAAASVGDVDGRRAALAALSKVARTGTQLFLFVGYAKQFRGWGRGLSRAVGDWYLTKSVDDLAYQVLKYRQREGWTHRDLLRLAHPATTDDERGRLFDWICGRTPELTGLPLVGAFEEAQSVPTTALPALIRQHRLSWEMLPTEALNDPTVWEALLDNGIPQTALLRQLPRLTRLGLLDPLNARTSQVCAQLIDPARLRKARVHPVAALIAARTYAAGRSTRGSSTWTPSAPVVDALDAAFYQAFESVASSGKRHLLALDVSASMTQTIGGLAITAREASAALALVTARTESQHQIVGFTSRSRSDEGLSPLAISPRQRLDDVLRTVSGLPFGGTDCALPILHALAHDIDVDVFSIYTDNETWAGSIQPHEALTAYRKAINPRAKLVVVGMTATNFSIADPDDAGMLDVAGFDAAVPTLLSDFAAA